MPHLRQVQHAHPKRHVRKAVLRRVGVGSHWPVQLDLLALCERAERTSDRLRGRNVFKQPHEFKERRGSTSVLGCLGVQSALGVLSIMKLKFIIVMDL